jgi:predicted choloylglycine hydrolase
MEARDIRGTAFERGYQHGKAFMQKAINCMHYWFDASKVNGDEPEVTKRLETIENNLTKSAPFILEELSGLASAIGIPFSKILLFNSITEFGAIEEIAHCTNVVMAETPYGVLHAYNWDHFSRLAGQFIIGESTTLGNGVKILRVSWVGTTWTIAGINSFGLTQGISGVWTTDTNWNAGIPSNILLRLPLEICTDVEEAISFLEQIFPITHGHNIVFADAKGNAAVVEKTPTKQAVRRLNKGALFCTNMFLSENMDDVVNKTKFQTLTNARQRDQNLENLLRNNKISTDLDGIQQIMRFHSSQGSICSHGGTGDINGLQSNKSFIMVPNDHSLMVTEGLPCKFPYIPLQAWLF